MQSLKELLKTSQEEVIVFDVGGHHGETCKLINDVITNAIIYSFEPYSSAYNILAQNVKFLRNVYAFNFGLSDSNGIKDFYVNIDSATNSLLPIGKKASSYWGDKTLRSDKVDNIPFKTLDSVVSDLKIQRIDILKMDVQGTENLVLLGAQNSLKNKLIKHIYTEIIVQPTYSGQKSLDQLLTIYYEAGFKLHNLYNFALSNKGHLLQCDAVFSHNENFN